MALDRDTVVRLLFSGRASLLGYINSIVRDWDLADDVLQEVSILALNKCDFIRDEAHFGGWARRTARLESLNLLRKRERGPQLLGDAVLDLLDAAWDAAEAAVPSDSLAALRTCMEKLTPDSQRILQLRYADGIKGAELARLLDQPANTVYVRLSRIHRQLGKCITQEIAERENRP
jgi:RNA polymerase sigma-70 factor, ECF subfamily